MLRRVFTHCILLTSGYVLLGMGQTQEISAYVHSGTGTVLPYAAVLYDSSSILEITDLGPDSDAPGGEWLPHLTPLLSDLNLYDGNNLPHLDSLLLSRGIGTYLYKTDHLIYARKIGFIDTLVARYLDFSQPEPLNFYREFTRFQDNMEAYHALPDFPDSLPLPWPGSIPVKQMRQLDRDQLMLWFRIDDKRRLKLTADFMERFPCRAIVHSSPELLRSATFPNAVFLVDLRNASAYLKGDLQDVGGDSFLDYNDEFLILMPRFTSFWESLTYFNNRQKQTYTDEQILQLYTVIPNQFFSRYFDTGLIEAGAPAQFALFSTFPFSLRSIVQKVVISGRERHGC